MTGNHGYGTPNSLHLVSGTARQFMPICCLPSVVLIFYQDFMLYSYFQIDRRCPIGRYPVSCRVSPNSTSILDIEITDRPGVRRLKRSAQHLENLI